MSEREWMGLYEQLREFRLRVAEQNELPQWWCSNRVLKEIASRRPSTVESFLALTEVKRTHAEYAERIVGIVRQYCRENGLPMDPVRQKRLPDVRKQRRARRRLRATIGSMKGVEIGLYRELEQLRQDVCGGCSGKSRFFHDFALRDMARRRPSNRESFMKVHGVGGRKCDGIDDFFIGVIRNYCKEHSLEMDVEFVWGEEREREMTQDRQRRTEDTKKGGRMAGKSKHDNSVEISS
ncbi:MAG: HRDC domain-containing protein [Planctomycetota bacterium]|jgi:superfamily II DNA helicase RecQ